MDDLISRQAAIDAFTDEIQVTGRANAESVKAYVKLVADRIKRLPSAQPEQRWIPCSERLPDKYGLYLVTIAEKAKAEDLGFDLDEIDVKRMRYNSNGWLLPRHIPAWINAAVTDEVIAWMPLPEPYKERREE